MAYWDTSCLIKLYAPEPDSPHLQALILQGASVVTSEITRLELHAALWRKEAANNLPVDGARQALKAYEDDVSHGLVEVWPLNAKVIQRFESIVEKCYRRSPMIPLRTLDAIHIATATDASESEIVATDSRLRDAAVSLGFLVYPTF